ncbi:MAG: amylo-alpha-1,6-glucosidase, partial [Tardiphaga sp.]
YFISIYEYLRASHDEDFVLQELLPVLKDIVDWHFRGTRYNIHVESARATCQSLSHKPNRGLKRPKHYFFRQNLCRSNSVRVFCCDFQ